MEPRDYKAVERSATVRRLALCLLLAGSLASGGSAATWTEVTSAHFTVYSDLPASQAEALTRSSEQLVAALDVLSPSASRVGRQRLTLYAFATQEGYERYAGDRGGSGFLQSYRHGMIGAFAARDEPIRRIQRHAVLHLLETRLPGLPEWFLQGLAEFYSTFRLTDDEIQVGLPLNLSISIVNPTPIAEILAADRQAAQRIPDFGPRSWAAVHYLTFGDDALRQQAGTYLALIRELERPQRAFVRAFGITAEELDRRLKVYLEAETIAYLRIPTSLLGTPVLNTRRLDENEAAIRLNELQLHSSPGRLQVVAADLERIAALVPDLPAAHLALAEAKIKLDDWDAALRALRQAVVLAPQDARAQLMLGETLLQLTRSVVEPEALRREAVAAFESSTELAPDVVVAWERLSLAYAGLPRISDRALEVGERAVELLPARSDLVFNLLLMRAKRRQAEAVRALVHRLAALEADPSLVTRGREMLFQLQLQEARRLMRDNRLDDALATLAEVRSRTTAETVRDTAGEWIRQIESARQHNEFARRYNAAVEAYNTSAYELALRLIKGLEPDTRGPYQERTLGYLREEVEYWRE